MAGFRTGDLLQRVPDVTVHLDATNTGTVHLANGKTVRYTDANQQVPRLIGQKRAPMRQQAARIVRSPIFTMYDTIGRFRSRRYDPNETILVAGLPRSGTTWLKELLGRITERPDINEPLNPKKVPHLVASHGLTSRTYRHPEADDPAMVQLFREVLAGRHAVPTKRDAQTTLKLLRGSPLIVKCIRLSFLLPFFHRHFPRVRTVFIIRDPYAVVASQISNPDGAWKGVQRIGRSYEPAIKDNPQLAPAFAPTTTSEVLAVHWCMENRFLVDNMRYMGGVRFVHYEDLYRDPARELPGLLGHLGIAWQDDYLSYVPIKSKSVAPGSGLLDATDPTRNYLRHLDETQLAGIGRVLDAYGHPFGST